jgi:thioredoxin 1
MKKDVGAENFNVEVLESEVPVLVDFWADWCMPCKMMESVMDDVAEELHGRLMVARLNVDEEPELATRYNIVSIPAFLLFKNGEVVDDHVGASPMGKIMDFVSPHLDGSREDI